MKRLFYLDNLKVWLTALVVFHHAALPYSPFSSWVYSLSNPDDMMPWIWHFHSTNAAFFMGLYFLISGYFVPQSFDKQGAWSFVCKKLKHLGIPVLAMAAIVMAATGQFEVGHLWFVESLLLFCLLYAVVRCFCKPIKSDCNSRPTILGMLVFGLVMGVGSYFIRQASPQDHWVWLFGFIHIEPAHYLQYVMMFVLGLLANRYNWFEKVSNLTGIIAMSIGAMLAVGNYLRGEGAWNDFVDHWFGIYESLLCVFLSFGLIWLFRQFGRQSGAFWRWCSAQSYGAYIIHLFVLLAIEFATDSIVMPSIAKFLLVGFIATIFSFVLTWVSGLIKLPRMNRTKES